MGFSSPINELGDEHGMHGGSVRSRVRSIHRKKRKRKRRRIKRRRRREKLKMTRSVV